MTRLVLPAAIIAAALLLQQFAQFPIQNAFTNSLTNWLHVPMFTAIGAALIWLRPNWKPLSIAAALLGIALVSEGLQLLSARQASLVDIACDLLGGAVSLLILRPWTTARLVLTCLVSLAITFAAPSRYLLAYAHQKDIFPCVYTPSAWQLSPLRRGSADVEATATHNWPEYAGKAVLALTWDTTRWPGVHFVEPIGLWTDYEHLAVDVYNREETAQPLTAGVRHFTRGGTSRYVQNQLKPGHNRLQIPLSKLALLDSGRPATIRHLMLYTTDQHAGKRLWLGDVCLN